MLAIKPERLSLKGCQKWKNEEMTETQDYFRLYENFYSELPIKAIRKLAGGDTYVTVYLRMLIKAQANNGYIRHYGILPTLSEEIALDLGETRETITATLSILEKFNLIEIQGTESLFFRQCQIGQESIIDIQ